MRILILKSTKQKYKVKYSIINLHSIPLKTVSPVSPWVGAETGAKEVT